MKTADELKVDQTDSATVPTLPNGSVSGSHISASGTSGEKKLKLQLKKVSTGEQELKSKAQQKVQLTSLVTPHLDSAGSLDQQQFVFVDANQPHAKSSKPSAKKDSAKALEKEREALEDVSMKRWEDYLSKNNSIVSDSLMGQLMSRVQCESCHTSTYSFEPFYILELAIPEEDDNTTLVDLLNHFEKSEVIHDLNWDCQKCKGSKSIRKTNKIYKLPPVLVVCFKRFQPNEGGGFKKNNALVQINLTGENLAQFEAGSPSLQNASPKEKAKKLYKPFFIIVRFS